MSPALSDGDGVLVQPRAEPSIGDVVLAVHPYRSGVKVLKRVTAIENDRYFLSGDNPEESTDSRTLGTFARKDIVGKIVCRLK